MRLSPLSNLTRREMLVGASAVMLAAVAAPSSRASDLDPSLGAARRQAAHRRRRVVYNNDGDDIWTPGVHTIDDFLADRHEPLLGSHVDSIHYCTTQCFNLFTHDTDVAERFLVREGMFANNNFEKFLAQKTDGLQMSTQFAKQHGLESIWSLRMNDIHDVAEPLFGSQWKKKDPSRIMGTREEGLSHNDRRRLWTLVDFEHPDVEPQVVAIVEEVLQKYQVDGVELDWLRAPFYFRTAYQGEAATGHQTDLLTRLVTAVRGVVLRESEKQGKPFLLKTRVPVTIENCRRIGIDVAAWLQAGLIDVLSVSGGYVPFSQPIRGLIDLGHQHDVPVYACISKSGMAYRTPRSEKETTLPIEAWYAAAQRCFAEGADGIYTFNLFANGKAPITSYVRSILNYIGDPKALQGVDKYYFVSDAGNFMPKAFWAKDVEDFDNDLPITLTANEPSTAVPLVVYDSSEQLQLAKSATLIVDFVGLAENPIPNVVWNGTPLTPDGDAEGVALVRRQRFAVATDSIRSGDNSFAVTTPYAGVELAGADLSIRYGETS
ncbi:MAG: hypothetical protein O3C60_20065 [Planctomycetota bacterium]|nr:hypothetical protein [Planctomycetota bacterium]